MKREAIKPVAVTIANTVREMHEGRRTWNKACGQWIVYRLETVLGFGNSADLCGQVEHAFKRRLPLEATIENALVGYYQAAGKLED